MTLWILVTAFAYFVKGVTGFANTLIITGVMAFSSANAAITPVEVLLGFPSNALMVWKERRNIQPRKFIPVTLLLLAGTVPGALLLKTIDARAIKILCGLVFTGLGLQMLLLGAKQGKLKPNRAVLTAIAVASGIMGGLFGIGALMSTYMSRVTEDSHAFKGNLCAVFICDNLFRIGLYACWGMINAEVLRQALILLPCMLIGLLAGMYCARFLKEDAVKRVIQIMLVISGVALTVTAIAG